MGVGYTKGLPRCGHLFPLHSIHVPHMNLAGEHLHALDLLNLAVRNTNEEGATRPDGQTH